MDHSLFAHYLLKDILVCSKSDLFSFLYSTPSPCARRTHAFASSFRGRLVKMMTRDLKVKQLLVEIAACEMENRDVGRREDTGGAGGAGPARGTAAAGCPGGPGRAGGRCSGTKRCIRSTGTDLKLARLWILISNVWFVWFKPIIQVWTFCPKW